MCFSFENAQDCLGEQLRKQNKINDFRLNFIISSVNYRQILNYSKKAMELGAEVDFLLLDKKDGSTKFLENYDLYNVASSKHPEFNKFIDIINSSEFKNYSNVHINKEIQKLKKVPTKIVIQNKFNFLINKIKMNK